MNPSGTHHNHTYLLRVSMAGMEFCWAYAWMVFITIGLTNRLFPLIACATAFLFSTLLTSLINKPGVRVIYGLLFHTTLFTIVSISLIYFLYSAFDPIHIKILLNHHLNIPDHAIPGVVSTFITVLLFTGILVFWIQGALFATRTSLSDRIGSRFDAGIRSFFYLIFVNALLVKLPDHTADYFFFPFVIFSLLSTAVSKNEMEETKAFMNGYQGIGLIIGFSMVILFLGTGAVMLAVPYGKQAAVTGFEMVKGVFVTILNWIHQVFSFMPKMKTSRMYSEGIAQEFIARLPSESPFVDWLFRGVVLFVEMITLAVLGVLALYLMKRLVKWLFSRTEGKLNRTDHTTLFLRIMAWLKRVFFSLGRKLFQYSLRDRSASRIYARLLSWGRRSGFPIFPSETPAIYGAHLTRLFPSMEREIRLITDMVNREVYGGATHKKEEIRAARMALKRLSSYRFWPLRLKLVVRGGRKIEFGKRHKRRLIEMGAPISAESP